MRAQHHCSLTISMITIFNSHSHLDQDLQQLLKLRDKKDKTIFGDESSGFATSKAKQWAFGSCANSLATLLVSVNTAHNIVTASLQTASRSQSTIHISSRRHSGIGWTMAGGNSISSPINYSSEQTPRIRDNQWDN
ncbi:hypothetical protein J6590_059588 [Homalodisca vitripennis]|nr:hypothetical protein J6590_059588 [Homalodisca vitripennis]